MKLLAVELKGFKSFAHKTTFHINEGLTAIIGPNGSGKSCLADSIRWVLGEQSLKDLRARKSDDVIFAGSPQHARSGAAEVVLTLSNEEGRLPVAAAEVAIARRITRAGESEYTLNGDPVRLQDIQQLLAEAGMGTKSYTVISQGTVDRYLQATPAARRELFDEATGIKALQLKVGRAERQLHQAARDADGIRTVLQELAPRVRVLKRQVQRQEERTALLQAYSEQQAAWFIASWREQAGAVASSQQHTEALAERITRARHERQHVEAELLQAAQPAHDQQLLDLQATLQRATLAFDDAARRHAAQTHEQEALAASLQTLKIEQQRAEAAVTHARQHIMQDTLFQTMPALLQRCRALLENLAAGQVPELYDVQQLQRAIDAALADSGSEQQMIDAAAALVQQLEGPLQAAARVRALEQERTERLSALSITAPPSPADLEAARTALNEYKATHAAAPDATALQTRLHEVRTEELRAEREGSAVQAAAAHAREAQGALEREIRRERGTAFLTDIANAPLPDRVPTLSEVQTLAARLSAIGEIDPLALQEYGEVHERCRELEAQLHDIEATARDMQQLISSLQRQMHQQFKQQFSIIQQGFKRYVAELFDGGEAHLEIVETVPDDTDPELAPTDPVSGIEILVHPPGKKLQHIQLLSGGEKALTSLALLLAVLEVQQPPFLVLDEVDAALDEANSYRFATLLKAKSATTQCIVISHNRETMGQADVLYGISMQQDGVSKAYSVKLSDLAATGDEMSI